MSAPELSEHELVCMRGCYDQNPERYADEIRLLDEHAALKRSQCTQEERAVLDAMGHLKNATLFAIQSDTEAKPGLTRVMSAELARRQAARKGG